MTTKHITFDRILWYNLVTKLFSAVLFCTNLLQITTLAEGKMTDLISWLQLQGLLTNPTSSGQKIALITFPDSPVLYKHRLLSCFILSLIFCAFSLNTLSKFWEKSIISKQCALKCSLGWRGTSPPPSLQTNRTSPLPCQMFVVRLILRNHFVSTNVHASQYYIL